MEVTRATKIRKTRLVAELWLASVCDVVLRREKDVILFTRDEEKKQDDSEDQELDEELDLDIGGLSGCVSLTEWPCNSSLHCNRFQF